MRTVWIFLGSGATVGGTGAAADIAGAAGAGAMGAGTGGAGATGVRTLEAATTGATGGAPGAPGVGADKIGMVEITRGAVVTGAGTSTGFSSRDTSFSPELELGEPA